VHVCMCASCRDGRESFLREHAVFLQRLVLVAKGMFYFVLFYGNRFWCIALASHHLKAFSGWLVVDGIAGLEVQFHSRQTGLLK